MGWGQEVYKNWLLPGRWGQSSSMGVIGSCLGGWSEELQDWVPHWGTPPKKSPCLFEKVGSWSPALWQVYIMRRRAISPYVHIPSFSPSCGQQVCQVSHDLSQMLLLVPGEVHQIPQQECLHHGE